MASWLHCNVTLYLFLNVWGIKCHYFSSRHIFSALASSLVWALRTYTDRHTHWAYLRPVFDLTLPLYSQWLRSKQHPDSLQAACKWLWWNNRAGWVTGSQFLNCLLDDKCCIFIWVCLQKLCLWYIYDNVGTVLLQLLQFICLFLKYKGEKMM